MKIRYKNNWNVTEEDVHSQVEYHERQKTPNAYQGHRSHLGSNLGQRGQLPMMRSQQMRHLNNSTLTHHESFEDSKNQPLLHKPKKFINPSFIRKTKEQTITEKNLVIVKEKDTLKEYEDLAPIRSDKKPGGHFRTPIPEENGHYRVP